MTVQPLHQQALVKTLGERRALAACLPTCFFMLARANGYLTATTLADFSSDLDWNGAHDPAKGWLRAKLSHDLRERYHLPIVSWKLSPISGNLEAMLAAGYLSSRREQYWYNSHVKEHTVEEIVRSGTPVIVTARPGFGQNKAPHAIILTRWSNDTVDIIDPDQRNAKTRYTSFEINAAMSPIGAASVVLPKL